MRYLLPISAAVALGALLSACGGSGFSVAMTGSPEASPTNDSDTVVPDASGGATELVDASDETQTTHDGMFAGGDVGLADGAGPADGPGLMDGSEVVDAPTRACPSTCAQLNANCGAVADTFCGGLVQCGSCTAGVCGGAAPSMCGCPTGQLACAAGCVNPMTDSANCGKCGVSCAASSIQGEACVAGACGCGPGTVMCFGQQANYCQVAYKACF
jgi:hypothetical protein